MKILTRKSMLSLLLCALLLALVPVSAVSAENRSISTHARAAALIDVTSGRILYSSRGDEPMLIASLTKNYDRSCGDREQRYYVEGQGW
ncbi:hypothetical protein ACFTAO_30280 [Paenibacillus rhizoplanae]